MMEFGNARAARSADSIVSELLCYCCGMGEVLVEGYSNLTDSIAYPFVEGV